MGAPTNGGAVVVVVAPRPATIVVVLDGDDLRNVEPGVVVGVTVTDGSVVKVTPDRVVVGVVGVTRVVGVVGVARVVGVVGAVVVVMAVVDVVGDATWQVGDAMVLSSSVTAPFRASARP
jgi:hypothetical protein